MAFLQIQAKQMQQAQLQSLRLLQMSTPELYAYLQELSLENPLMSLDIRVREADFPAPQAIRELNDRLQWIAENDRQNAYYQTPVPSEYDPFATIGTDGGLEETLYRFLSRQITQLSVDTLSKDILTYYALCLDDDGYLRVPLTDLAKDLSLSQKDAEAYLKQLQSLNPAGAGARTLSECLELQLLRRNEAGAALLIVRHHLEALGGHRYHAIARSLHISQEQVREAEKLIRSLDPRPGSAFDAPHPPHYICPDVRIIELDGQLAVQLNVPDHPLLKIDPYYLSLLNQSDDKEVIDYLSSKLRQTELVLWSISQRERTIARCTQAILTRQSKFFQFGPSALLPMRLNDVAADLGLHESTVSRALRGKYLQCNRGVFPMSYFFSRIASIKSSTAVGGTAARALLQELIRQEDKSHPLSDHALCQILSERGCSVSRRTVAKYRSELGIPSTVGRKMP